jgi:glutathione S-transferase
VAVAGGGCAAILSGISNLRPGAHAWRPTGKRNLMLKLYDRELSGNAYKIRLLLSLLDLPCDKVDVPMQGGKNVVDEDYLSLNPRGQIPTLQDGELTLWGSTAILCYLASRYDQDDRWLPREPARLGLVMQWLELAQNEILSGLGLARVMRLFGVPGDLEQAQAVGRKALEVLESRLGGADWLVGDHATLADIACFPYVALAHQGEIDIAPFPGTVRWIERVKALDGFVAMPGLQPWGNAD